LSYFEIVFSVVTGVFLYILVYSKIFYLNFKIAELIIFEIIFNWNT
jgi:hypothetical protein